MVAVGETGLDFYRRLSTPDDQRRVFRIHIALARESGKPLIVHVRDAWEDALAILGEEKAERVILHCFSGDERIAAEAMARGYIVSFAGNLTYPKSVPLRLAADVMEETQILVETDSPFLPPQSRRGSANQPSNLTAVLSELAEVRRVNLDRIIGSTAHAARAAFSLLP